MTICCYVIALTEAKEPVAKMVFKDTPYPSFPHIRVISVELEGSYHGRFPFEKDGVEAVVIVSLVANMEVFNCFRISLDKGGWVVACIKAVVVPVFPDIPEEKREEGYSMGQSCQNFCFLTMVVW